MTITTATMTVRDDSRSSEEDKVHNAENDYNDDDDDDDDDDYCDWTTRIALTKLVTLVSELFSLLLTDKTTIDP